MPGGGRLRQITDTEIEQIKSYTNKKNGCWEWIGALESGSNQPVYYGHRIRRLLYERLIGRTRKRIGVVCKNQRCINPEHFYTASKVGSAIPAYKSVMPETMYGTDNFNNKLTEEQVLEIRQRYKIERTSYRKLAEEYGVEKTTIGHIIRNEQWAWLTEETKTNKED